MLTISIMDPPVRNGGMELSRSDLPQRIPIPVGPSILCPLHAAKSAPRSATFTGMCGTDWQRSTMPRAPTACAISMISLTGLMVPKRFDWCTIDTHFVVESITPGSMLSRPSSVTANQRRLAPVFAHSSCQGIRLAWCSISLTTIESPGPITNR